MFTVDLNGSRKKWFMAEQVSNHHKKITVYASRLGACNLVVPVCLDTMIGRVQLLIT
jgi:hypothetical protein